MSKQDVLSDIEHAMKNEQAVKFWKEHASLIVTAIVLIIIGTAANTTWQSYKKTQQEKETTKLVEALKSATPLESLKAVSAEKSGGGTALAGLNGAALALEKKDWATAITLYQNVVDTKSAPSPFRDLAIVQLASLRLDHDKKAEAKDLLTPLIPIINDKNNPWQSRALLISALIKASKGNDLKGAKEDMQVLMALPGLAPNFAAQAKALDEVYSIQLAKDAK